MSTIRPPPNPFKMKSLMHIGKQPERFRSLSLDLSPPPPPPSLSVLSHDLFSLFYSLSLPPRSLSPLSLLHSLTLSVLYLSQSHDLCSLFLSFLLPLSLSLLRSLPLLFLFTPLPPFSPSIPFQQLPFHIFIPLPPSPPPNPYQHPLLPCLLYKTGRELCTVKNPSHHHMSALQQPKYSVSLCSGARFRINFVTELFTVVYTPNMKSTTMTGRIP